MLLQLGTGHQNIDITGNPRHPARPPLSPPECRPPPDHGVTPLHRDWPRLPPAPPPSCRPQSVPGQGGDGEERALDDQAGRPLSGTEHGATVRKHLLHCPGETAPPHSTPSTSTNTNTTTAAAAAAGFVLGQQVRQSVTSLQVRN